MKPVISSKRTLSAGFTLIEVLAVVVIVAILSAIAAPSWLQYMNNQRIGAVNNDLAQSIKRAQQDAIQQRQSVKVTVNSGAASPSINVDSEVDTGIDVAGDGVDITLAQGSDIREGLIGLEPPTVAGGADETLIFDYQGNVSQENVLPYVLRVDTVSNPSRQQCVIVANIIGSIKTAREADCNNPTVNP